MEDFYRLYEDLPVPELVRIARTPSDYMPEAVSAAERILKERGIAKEEIDAEEWAIAQKEMEDGINRHKRRDYAAWIGELFGRDLSSDSSETWLMAFILLYSIYYLYNIFVVIRQIAWLYKHGSSSFGTALLISDLILASYITLCFYYILKQLWLGWSLLLILAVYIICKKFSILFHHYAHHELFFARAFMLTLPTLIYVMFGVILWRPFIITTFKIDAKIKSLCTHHPQDNHIHIGNTQIPIGEKFKEGVMEIMRKKTF